MSQNCKEYLAQGPSMIFYNSTIFNRPRYEAQKSRISSHLKPEFDILWKQPLLKEKKLILLPNLTVKMKLLPETNYLV